MSNPEVHITFKTTTGKFEIDRHRNESIGIEWEQNETCYQIEISDLETASSEEEEEVGRWQIESHRRDLG